jgi:hypothetical protein
MTVTVLPTSHRRSEAHHDAHRLSAACRNSTILNNQRSAFPWRSIKPTANALTEHSWRCAHPQHAHRLPTAATRRSSCQRYLPTSLESRRAVRRSVRYRFVAQHSTRWTNEDTAARRNELHCQKSFQQLARFTAFGGVFLRPPPLRTRFCTVF